jgi:hypothetical protein
VAEGQCVVILNAHGVNNLFKPVQRESLWIAAERELCLEVFEVQASWV